MQKKHKLLYYCYFFIIFLFLSANFCLAITLEVDYPPLSTGASITVNTTIPEYLKYVFDFGMFIGFSAVFLSLVYTGVLYFLSPAIPSALASARDRISGSISGLLILTLLYLIITTINPALSIFKTTALQKLPPSPPAPPPPPGVFLYKDVGCPKPDPDLKTESIPDLSQMKLSKQLQSIKIRNKPDENTYFFAFLYENPKFRGECLPVGYSSDCKNVKPFASSVDIYKYSFTANGDITIYRNSSFSEEGGYLNVKSSDIQASIQQQKVYIIDLNNAKFIDSSAKSQDNPDGCTVPKEQQDCIKYDKNGKCLQRICPTLAEKNIGSIKIQGDYLVLVVYYNPSDPQNGDEVVKNGSWNLCQSFPSPDDVNKEGPRQINWEDIRNKGSTNLPNWIVIFPIEKNIN